MSKLLSAELHRLFKSNLYKVYMAVSVLVSAVLVISRWRDVRLNTSIYENLPVEYRKADDVIFVGSLVCVFLMAIFTGLFVGTEYSDGTIRNKLIVGHKRSNIYLSKLVVCITANIMVYVLSAMVSWGLGSLLLGVNMTFGEFFERTVKLLFLVIAMTALLLLFAMLIQSKAAGSVACLALMIVLIVASVFVQQKLDAPEYFDDLAYYDMDTGEYVREDKHEKNPYYVSGKKRAVYEFVNDFLPSGQLFQICAFNPKNSIMLYDGIILIGTTLAGVVIFKKKNLK
ncbi:MAG: ABC transporter permease [Clostridium sp.]|nr:ABC transporter permease [Clostridium sp.]MCM1398353.1 ABC transporter permease [Clostridium sp.]MCM1458982.1 ABC transporter permease [Bacteroides sp.]